MVQHHACTCECARDWVHRSVLPSQVKFPVWWHKKMWCFMIGVQTVARLLLIHWASWQCKPSIDMTKLSYVCVWYSIEQLLALSHGMLVRVRLQCHGNIQSGMLMQSIHEKQDRHKQWRFWSSCAHMNDHTHGSIRHQHAKHRPPQLHMASSQSPNRSMMHGYLILFFM